jgi:adenylate kinase
MFNMIMFGPPGSGKGTQSKLVADYFKFLHLSTGELFRQEIAAGSAMGELVKVFINRGLLIPDNIVMRELYRYALAHQNAPGIAFDGFPRNPDQAAMLDKVFHKKELRIALVVSIQVPDQELIQRVLERGKDSGRTDDNAEIMQKRLEVYREFTLPVINYYKKSKRLVEVNGSRPVKIVSDDIKSIVTQAMKEKL